MNRLVIFKSDSTAEKTASVIEAIKSRYTKPLVKKKRDFSQYHNFFSSIKPRPVLIPYIDEIKFDTSQFETRRSSKIFFDLLCTVALMNQNKRKIDTEGRIISEGEDFKTLISFTKKRQPEQNIPLSPCQKAVFDIISQDFSNQNFTYQDLMNTGPKDELGKVYEISGVKKSLAKLIEIDLVEVVKNGRPMVFRAKFRKMGNQFGVIDGGLLSR